MSDATPPPVSEKVADEAVADAAKSDAIPDKVAKKAKSAAGDAARAVSSPWASAFAIFMAIAWTTPTLGLFITSFRKQEDIQTSGWWTAFSTP